MQLGLVSFVAIVTIFMGAATAATLQTTTEESVGVEPFKQASLRCTAHSVCSCLSGIAICHGGSCHCLFALTNTNQLDIEAKLEPPISTQLNHLEHHNKRCSVHSDCSCMEGIAICHEWYCHCIMSQYICTAHQECSNLCQNKIGICFYNACKCFNMVEDVRLSESISPMMDEVPPH